MNEFISWFKKESCLVQKNSIFLIINNFSQLSFFFPLSNKIYFFKKNVYYKKCKIKSEKNINFLPKNFFGKFYPKFQIFFSFEKNNLNMVFFFKILKNHEIKILFFFFKEKFAKIILSKKNDFCFNRVCLYIRFLTKPYFCKNFLKNFSNFKQSSLVKFFIRKHVPKIIILKWDKFFRICSIINNKTWGKYIKNIELLSEYRKNILDVFCQTENYLKSSRTPNDLLQRSLDEMGIITSKINLIGINEIIFLLNHFL